MKLKSIFYGLLCGLVITSLTFPAKSETTKPPVRQIYQLIIYHIKDQTQEQRLDKYLSEAYLPALHRSGIKTVGVFKTANIDTAKDKRIYIFLPFNSTSEFLKNVELLERDKQLQQSGAEYLNAKFDDAPYLRKESILLQAFTGMPLLKKPNFTEPKSGRIYELRSYESATEMLNVAKVRMFNEEEVEIFDRIGSQPMFYAEVLAGSRMPNLMYMTTYSSPESREAHWKTFSSDSEWKRISALPEYQHVVSKADIIFLVPANYSDL